MEISINQKEQNELTAVYTQLNDEQKAVLNDIFGEDTFKPKDIRDRVKTFEDACTVLGIDPDEWKKKHLMLDKDVLAYLKLRVITQALNEGWYPKFTEDERRYYPWFYILTQEENDNLSAEEKRRCVGRAYGYANAFGGLVCASAHFASSYSSSSSGARLAFSNYDLAVYVGKQFIDIWADFVLEIRDENSNTQQS
jgi:hypothetical protein